MTASLHKALGSMSEDPDISALPFTTLYQHSLYQSLRAAVRNELSDIRKLVDSSATDVPMRELLAAEHGLLERLKAIRGGRMSGRRIRVHGDFRLDEVRIVEGRFTVIDLSGDHSLPMSERRLRASPLRDVAEMLRSIDYIAGHCALEAEEPGFKWAPWWGRAVGLRFVESYLDAMQDSLLLPDDPADVDTLLDSYMIVRALRELRWELTIRRGWVDIPLDGLRRILDIGASDLR